MGSACFCTGVGFSYPVDRYIYKTSEIRCIYTSIHPVSGRGCVNVIQPCVFMVVYVSIHAYGAYMCMHVYAKSLHPRNISTPITYTHMYTQTQPHTCVRLCVWNHVCGKHNRTHGTMCAATHSPMHTSAVHVVHHRARELDRILESLHGVHSQLIHRRLHLCAHGHTQNPQRQTDRQRQRERERERERERLRQHAVHHTQSIHPSFALPHAKGAY